MRQRNAQSTPVDVPNIPVQVQPGEVIDYPVLITGFEVVEDAPAKSKKTAINEGPAPTA